MNVDLAGVTGTGAGGLITKQDLETFIRSGKEGSLLSPLSENKEIPLSANQLTVTRNLVMSKTEIPHFYLKVQVFTDRLLNLRQSEGKDGKKVSVYSILIYTAANALKEFKELNSYFRDNKLIVSDIINVGFAVAAGGELYVPVIKNDEVTGIRRIGAINLEEINHNDSVLWLDAILISKPKIFPNAEDIKFRFGLESPTYNIILDELEIEALRSRQKMLKIYFADKGCSVANPSEEPVSKVSE